MAQDHRAENRITEEQIAAIVHLIEPELSSLPYDGESIQRVINLRGANLAREFIETMRKYVREARSHTLGHRFHIDRSVHPDDRLRAIKCYRDGWFDYHVDLSTMPRGEGDEVELFFFYLKEVRGIVQLEQEYALRGLKPDPYAQLVWNLERNGPTGWNRMYWRRENGRVDGFGCARWKHSGTLWLDDGVNGYETRYGGVRA